MCRKWVHNGQADKKNTLTMHSLLPSADLRILNVHNRNFFKSLSYVLGHLECDKKNRSQIDYKQRRFISHSPGGWDVLGQVANRFSMRRLI